MAKTKILVLQMKELIYTAIFAGFLILLIVLLVIMFSPSDKKDNTGAADGNIYTPGVYNSQIALGDAILNVEVVVDADQIKSVSFVNLESSVETMYPLLSPSMKTIEEQLIHGTKPDEVQLSERGKFTETLLLEGVKTALNKALINPV